MGALVNSTLCPRGICYSAIALFVALYMKACKLYMKVGEMYIRVVSIIAGDFVASAVRSGAAVDVSHHKQFHETVS